jgi:hypothetical protein
MCNFYRQHYWHNYPDGNIFSVYIKGITEGIIVGLKKSKSYDDMTLLLAELVTE